MPSNPVHQLLLRKYYVDELYDFLFVRPYFALADWCARVFDHRVIDGAVNGIGALVVRSAQGLRHVQTGVVMNYALGILIGAVAVVAYLVTRR